MKIGIVALIVSFLSVVIGSHVGGYASLGFGFVAFCAWGFVLQAALFGGCYSDGTCISI